MNQALGWLQQSGDQRIEQPMVDVHAIAVLAKEAQWPRLTEACEQRVGLNGPEQNASKEHAQQRITHQGHSEVVIPDLVIVNSEREEGRTRRDKGKNRQPDKPGKIDAAIQARRHGSAQQAIAMCGATDRRTTAAPGGNFQSKNARRRKASNMRPQHSGRACAGSGKQHHQRPDHVELLFDCQRPKVDQQDRRREVVQRWIVMARTFPR